MDPRKLLITIIAILTSSVYSMLIPQDIEILEGYEFDTSPEVYPDETYFEAKALADSLLLKAIRNKRSYHVLPSAGLRSHFQIGPEYLQDVDRSLDPHPIATEPRKPRSRRSVDNIDPRSKPDDQKASASNPTAAKQVMDSEYYTKGNWNIHTFNTDYENNRKPTGPEDIDTVPDATANEGIKSRQPRVNFITQPKKNGADDDSKDRIASIIPKLTPTKSRYEKVETRFPETYPSRSYDQYLRRYDRYDEDYTYNRYDPYEDYYLHRRRYDPYDSYSPRSPSFPDPYYEYPDSRYDLPEPRGDYRPIYSNDIYERPGAYKPPLQHQPPFEPLPSSSRRRNRIIYYAHLPEVVRAPPSVDLTYRHARDRYDGYYHGGSYSPPIYDTNNYQAGSFNRGTNGDFVKRDKKDYRLYDSREKAGNHQQRGDIPVGRE